MASADEDQYIYLPLLRVGEAARYLGVGRRIIFQLIENDQIRAVKDGRSVRIEKKNLDAFRSSGKLT